MLTYNAVSRVDQLPVGYAQKIATVPGVRAVNSEAWFGGYFRCPSQAVYAIAVQCRSFFFVHPRDAPPPSELHALGFARTVVLLEALALALAR